MLVMNCGLWVVCDNDYLQAVPVRPSPNARTRMGTTRRHSLRLMSVSLVKTSVMGFGVYGWKAIVMVLL